jgi:4-amino-4-deoxy-L-arabinose transferase-like glycosyltransferase
MNKLFRNTTLLLTIILLLGSFLRVWQIQKNPVSLFGDELDLGYQAYSILKTGQDYSGNFMPLHFQSIAEWRTPLYLYSAVPSVALFGISPLGVRLPAIIFGILGIYALYLLVTEITKNKYVALLAALLMTISPWHIQYSRAGFEVTQMLAFYLFGIYFFLRSLREPKYLLASMACLAITPWIYSTEKLYLPITLLLLAGVWRKELLKFPRKYLLWAFIVFTLIAAPITLSTVFGGGTARFNYISIFSDPTAVPEIGFARLNDAMVRNPEARIGIQPTIIDRLFHNKITVLLTKFFHNYLQSFSTEFLFINGDPNPRQAVGKVGEFYKFEGLLILLGLFYLAARSFTKKPQEDFRIKIFIGAWLLTASIPAALTRDGGNHATRLFLLLPPIVFLVSWGIYNIMTSLKGLKKQAFIIALVGAYAWGFISYQHNYWNHYAWDSERWWHAGYENAIKTAYADAEQYDRVIISNAGEPSLIFFLGWSQFPPDQFHKNYPMPKETVPGFGSISKLDKFYFGQPSPEVDLYDLAKVLPDKTLYLAVAKEVKVNLILEPERLPNDLKMIKAVAYPSGEPAYYLLTKK